jgi:hypothetical protein
MLLKPNVSMWTEREVAEWALCGHGAPGACVALLAHTTASCITGLLVTIALIACGALLLMGLVFLLNLFESLLAFR